MSKTTQLIIAAKITLIFAFITAMIYFVFT